MRTAAFFDIDGTLYRNSLMIEHFNKMVQYEIVDPVVWNESVKHAYTEWRKRNAEYDTFMLALAEIYYEALRGRVAGDLEFISKQVIAIHGDIVYRYTRDQIRAHRAAGHKVFFISGSPEFLVSKMAEKYEADDYRATRYLLDAEGRYTGEVVPMWDSESKDQAIHELVLAHDIDLAASYAYGDTNGDFSMLQSVGHPVAINPARELLMRIKQTPDLAARASIIVERKDIIYRLDAQVETLDVGDHSPVKNFK